MLLACVGLAVAASGAHEMESPALRMSVFAATTSGVFVVLALGFAGMRPLPPGARAGRLGLGPGILDGRALAALALGTIALSHALDAAIHLSGAAEVGALAELDAALRGMTPAELPVALVCLALAPGLAEELFFRGLVQRAVVARLGAGPTATALAIGTAAVLFALAHFDPVHSPGALILGVYLGVAAWLSGSTRAAMLCHVLNNGVAVLGGYLGAEIGLGEHAAVTFAAGILVAAACLRPAWRGRWRPPAGPTPNPLQTQSRSTDP